MIVIRLSRFHSTWSQRAYCQSRENVFSNSSVRGKRNLKRERPSLVICKRKSATKFVFFRGRGGGHRKRLGLCHRIWYFLVFLNMADSESRGLSSNDFKITDWPSVKGGRRLTQILIQLLSVLRTFAPFSIAS